MNLYFLVEGKTEKKVYPAWLSYLLPHLSKIESPDDVSENNYFLISGGGYPSLLDNHLSASIEDVNNSGEYDFLIICLDSDNDLPDVRRHSVHEFIEKNNLSVSCKLEIILQARCMETWFAGNRKVFPRNPSDSFIPFLNFYNTSVSDPELMEKPQNFQESCSIYHYNYLKSMLSERKVRYSKTNPKSVVEKYYLDELKKRLIETPEHLSTLRTCLEFLDSLNS